LSSPEKNMKRRGVMLILSSPSGAGKSTLAEGLLKGETELSMSVSVTTRQPREGERHGVDYYFVDKDEFLRMQKAGELLEWAEVFGNFYGTPHEPVERALASGQDILFDVDWQGAAQLLKNCTDDLCRVFILPPSAEALEQRLKGRGKDKPEVVAHRMAQASREISHWNEYDHVIINDDLELALSQLRAILSAERTRRERNLSLPLFVNELLSRL